MNQKFLMMVVTIAVATIVANVVDKKFGISARFI